jgi:thymidine phosphorylase
MSTPLGTKVDRGQPLFIVHAEAPGELAYALEYLRAQKEIVEIAEGA